MRTFRSLSLALALAAAPAAALPSLALAEEAVADLSVSVTDAGDHVVVRARGLEAGDGAIKPRRSWLQVPVTESVTLLKRFSDPTIDKIEAVGGRSPYLGVRLRGDTELASAAAGIAVVRQLGDVLEITIPRAAVAAAAPTASPNPAPNPAPTTNPNPAPTASPTQAPNATPTATPTATDEVPAAATAPAAATVAGKPNPPVAGLKLAGKESAPTGNLMMLLVGGLVAAGGFALWKKRHHRKPEVDGSILELRASLPIGGRAKVIWVAAGSRELLLSVNDKDVHVLSQWQADGDQPSMPLLTGEVAAPAPLPADALAAFVAPPPAFVVPAPIDFAPPPPIAPEAPRPTLISIAGERAAPVARSATRSPTVNGLLALRDRQATPTDTIDPASDEEWSRMLLEATQRGAR